MTPAEHAIARVLDRNDRPAGLGFLIDDRHLVTCAHVINAVLGRDLRALLPPPDGTRILLDFCFLGRRDERTERRATVVRWLPEDDFDLTDVAVLRLGERVSVPALPLVVPVTPCGVQMWGPSPDRSVPGGHVAGQLMGTFDKSRLQVDEYVRGAFRTRPGFSGGPVWVAGTRHAVGMLQAVGRHDQVADVYVLSGAVLREAWAGNITPSNGPLGPSESSPGLVAVTAASSQPATVPALREVPAQRPALAVRRELVVRHDHARLYYDGGCYRLAQWRLLHNGTTRPVTQYLMRIKVDRYPKDKERSRRHHRDRPLKLEELGVTAWFAVIAAPGGGAAPPPAGESRAWEPMRLRLPPKTEEPATIELWLQFENENRKFWLYPGRMAWIHYTYQVSDEQWGRWFQRAVRHSTEVLSVELDFPADLDPDCWGVAESLGGEMPLPTEIIREDPPGRRTVFWWSTASLSDLPQVGDRYRLEWYFRRGVPEEGSAMTPSETMQRIGIVQRGNPMLTVPAREFDLPLESPDAVRLLQSLKDAADRVRQHHVFDSGMGIAAPQIGIGWAAAVVWPPDGGDYIELLNPRVVEASKVTSRVWEGCLSFFDVRGEVPRPTWLVIEHERIDGTTERTRLDGRLAGLIGHEVDHLRGVLFDSIGGVRLRPVQEYRELKAAGRLTDPG